MLTSLLCISTCKRAWCVTLRRMLRPCPPIHAFSFPGAGGRVRAGGHQPRVTSPPPQRPLGKADNTLGFFWPLQFGFPHKSPSPLFECPSSHPYPHPHHPTPSILPSASYSHTHPQRPTVISYLHFILILIPSNPQHPSPNIFHPTSFSQHPSSCILLPTSFTKHPSPSILQPYPSPTSCSLPVHYILSIALFISNFTSFNSRKKVETNIFNQEKKIKINKNRKHFKQEFFAICKL